MKWLVRISLDRPKTIIAAIAAITVFFAIMLVTNFSVNTDPMKSFSRKIDVIKYFHLTLKKFSMKDMILIGVENEKDGIFTVESLRYVERVIGEFKELKVKKTYKNIITGKEETVEVPSKLTPGQIMSVINADDVTVDKRANTVVIGNLTSKTRIKAGLLDPDAEEMKNLPAKDEDLAKLIPFLKNELVGNDLLRGTLFSADNTACTVMIPIEKRIDNKLEIIRRELPCMIDDAKLRERFSGGDYYFAYTIMDKKVDGTTVNDDYIKGITASNRRKLRSFVLDLLSPIGQHDKKTYETLKTAEVNQEYLDTVFRMIASESAYAHDDVDLTYQDCIEEFYKFVIERMDKFSRNNLESKLYSVQSIYDVGFLYKIFNDITAHNKPKNLKIYIAGLPVAEALLQEYVINDMSIFMSLTGVVILLILFLTIRTPTGIYLPLASVVVSIIWLMGAMLMVGIEFSSGTIVMPCVLIAVGSSYVIHYLIRYYEKIAGRGPGEVRQVLLETTDSIDTAIFLSAITTMAAFISDVFIDVVDIQRLGILVTLGIVINYFLTFTLVPAVLVLQPPPKGTRETFFERILMKWVMKGGENTARHPRAVFLGALAVTGLFFVGMFFLGTESSSSVMFLEKSPIRQATMFIDKKLTGTGQVCIVFKMRDRVSLANPVTQKYLTERIKTFTGSYRRFITQNGDLQAAAAMNRYFTDDLEVLTGNMKDHQKDIEDTVAVFTDIMNEFYEVAGAKNLAKKKDAGAPGDDLGSMAEEATANGGAKSAVENGLDDIIKRIPTLTSDAERAAARRFIAAMRIAKYTPEGKVFQGACGELGDFFHTDVTQPITLRKIEVLTTMLKDLKEPVAVIGDVKVNPVGNTISITDTIKIIYKVFYHEDNDAFRKIPDVKADGITDPSLTDRSVIGVCLSQFQASRQEIYKYLVSDDMKMMQYVLFLRSDKADFLGQFQDTFNTMFRKIFPDDDPYVEKIVLSGMPAINLYMNRAILINQIQSVVVTVIVVFLSCMFIFRSVLGGLFASVPILFTLVMTLGTMGFLGIPINYSTIVNASIAVGAGIDYCIHFIERFKYEHIEMKLDFAEAYRKTLQTTGLSIVTATLTVGLGFAVLGLSSFKIIKVSGLLVAFSMILSGALSLTVLPAMIIWAKPDFISKAKSWNLEEKMRNLLQKDNLLAIAAAIKTKAQTLRARLSR